MKKSELRNIINEEIQFLLREKRINPEIVSNKATHYDKKKKVKVKVYRSVKPGYDNDGNKMFTADIMSGPNKGKTTSVYEKDLKPIKEEVLNERGWVMSPEQMISGAVYNGLLSPEEARSSKVRRAAKSQAEELKDSWPEGEGFGSSDGTFYIKYMLDDAGFKTDFKQGRLIRKDIKGGRYTEAKDRYTEAYKPYKGGSGPDAKQVKENDIHLMNLLKNNGVKFSYKDMSNKYGVDPPFNLIVIRGKKGDIYAGYDRWGYVIEGPGFKEYDADQVDDKEALKLILNAVGIKEAVITEAEKTVYTMEQEIEKIAKKYFPNSYLDVYFSKNLLPHITIVFAIGQKKDWYNGIYHNDPLPMKILIRGSGMKEDGTIDGTLEFEPLMASLTLKAPEGSHLAYGRVKVGARKKKGDYNSIMKTVENTFAKMKKTVKDNLNNLDPEHDWVKKYI